MMKRTYYFEYKDADQSYFFKAEMIMGDLASGIHVSTLISRLKDSTEIDEDYLWSVCNCWENMTERQMIEDIDTRLAKIRALAW